MLPATRRLLWDDGPDIEVRGGATALDGWARPVQVAPPARHTIDPRMSADLNLSPGKGRLVRRVAPPLATRGT
jgi:hypothetical protein